MSIITEIVTIKLSSNVTKDKFFSSVDVLEKDFHSKQPGFIDTELLYDEKDDSWIMIQHWESMEQLKSASEKMFTSSAAEPFIKLLKPEDVKMIIAPQLGMWRSDHEKV